MTRCKEFYVKLEKDGNFCGMEEKAYREALQYSKEVEEDESGKPLLSEGAWLKQKRKHRASHKLVDSEEPKEKTPKKLWSKVEQAEYAQEVVRTFIANGVDPAVIRELIVKAIGVVEQE